MINNKALPGKIPPYALFFVLYISRVIVSLTNIQSVSVGKVNTQLLLSIALGMVLTLLLSLPAYFCTKMGMPLLNNKVLSLLYLVYYVYFCGVNICRFSYFAASRMSVTKPVVFFVILITIAVAYCSSMGIEAMGRFGFFCGLIVVAVVATVLVLNAHSFHAINFFPLGDSDKKTVLMNALIFCSNSNEPVILLALGKRTNGDITKPYFGSVIASFCSVLLLIACSIGVMGSGATMQAYPVFTLFQLASIGSFSRLDIVHVAFWILALLVKASVLVLSAADCIGAGAKKSVILSFVSGAVAIGIVQFFGTDMIEIAKSVSIVNFVVFALTLPLVYLVINRRKKREKI
ncbi:MAG: GerAB/ArcD/ProY family transporter [Eubacterium sp.]